MKTVEEFMSLPDDKKLLVIKVLIGFGWSDDIGYDLQIILDEIKG